MPVQDWIGGGELVKDINVKSGGDSVEAGDEIGARGGDERLTWKGTMIWIYRLGIDGVSDSDSGGGGDSADLLNSIYEPCADLSAVGFLMEVVCEDAILC